MSTALTDQSLSQSYRRDPRDVLAEQADLLNSVLAELRHIRVALGSGNSVSSIQIEDAAKGDPRITTKQYAGSELGREDVDQVLDTHAYAHRRAAEMAMHGWAETVATLRTVPCPLCGEPAPADCSPHDACIDREKAAADLQSSEPF